MEKLKQHYELLRINPGAKLDEIKQAYLLAEQNLHQDRLSDDPLVRHLAQERLRKINEAYMEIMDAYQEVRASLGSSAGMPAGMAEAEAEDDAARRSSRKQKSSGIPEEGDHPGDMPQSGAAAGKVQEEGVPDDAPFPAVDDTHDGRAERTGEKETPESVLPDKEAADSSDPADLLRKESYLLYALVALVCFVMAITWIRTARKSPPPGEPVKVSARGETVSPSEKPSERRRNLRTPSVKPGTPASRPGRQPEAGVTLNAGVVMRDAEQGNPRAQALLGYMYMTGKGARKDHSAGVRWFRTAAARGNAQAQDWLGYLYETGTGVSRNYPEAVRWYRMAAEQGDPDAQKNLGQMYARGRGVAKSRYKAIKWLRKAATQGNEEAQRALEIWQED